MSFFGKPVVEYEEANLDELRQIEPVLETFASKIGKKIWVENPHGRPKPQYHGKSHDLCIYFWCLPAESWEVRFQRTYRFKLEGGQRDGLHLSESQSSEGTKIIDTNGQTIALIVGKTLYILFDLPHSEGTHPDKILELILDDYYLYIKDREGFDNEMVRRIVELPKELFLNTFKIALNDHDGIAMETIEDKILELRRNLAMAVRDRRILVESKKIAPEVKLQENNEIIIKMYERLCKISTTGKITMSENEVIVPIGQIDIVDHGVTYDIGEFEVGIDLVDCEIKCYNKTRQINGHHHPHVDNWGVVCLGDSSYGLSLLLGDLELETVIYMMVEFLRSYNKRGCYEYVESWPVKEVEEY